MTAEKASGSVSVRMYRGILGDCFLLRHQLDAATVKHILIDCGVLQGVKNAKLRMKEIVSDLLQTTDGVLDLLVVTHEHHDHLSGFLYEFECFQKDFEIREFWLAWTENPNDPAAVALHERFDKAKNALTAFALHSKMTALKNQDVRIKTVLELSAFMGVSDGVRLNGASTLKMLKEKATPARTRYLEPGDVARPKGMSDLKAYVLGPPRDEALLRKDSPSKGTAKEVYLARQEDANAINLQLVQLDGKSVSDVDLPFASPHQRPLINVKQQQPKDRSITQKLYFDPSAAQRKIDDEWYSSAETLALKMDSDTNNTSLVLAFELPDGQVLLFPGDAQVGNWLSWSRQTYPRTPDPAPAVVLTIDEILARVTLYKVGHHCSHNATLRQLGLEKMTDPRLIAMIPVVTQVAQDNDWNMPYPELYEALKRKTSDRVIIGDSDIPTESATFKANPTAMNNCADLSYHPAGLWVEVRISYGP
jgi:beta-lactamase superfamily II metal-dependent hydrolase